MKWICHVFIFGMNRLMDDQWISIKNAFPVAFLGCFVCSIVPTSSSHIVSESRMLLTLASTSVTFQVWAQLSIRSLKYDQTCAPYHFY